MPHFLGKVSVATIMEAVYERTVGIITAICANFIVILFTLVFSNVILEHWGDENFTLNI